MTINEQIRALIVDDEPHIRALIKAVTSSIQGEVVAEASNGVEAVEIFAKLQPNLVLMDINMPVMDGISALKAIVSTQPEAFIIMLTSLSDMETIQACVDAGASGYLRKDTPVAELKKAPEEAWQDR